MTSLETLKHINSLAAFNCWCGIQVTHAEPGNVTIEIDWRDEFGQYSGFLHAGLIGTLIDTACGFAAATMMGPNLLASNFTVNCLRPATGKKFIARARVIKPGKSQAFTSLKKTLAIFALAIGMTLPLSGFAQSMTDGEVKKVDLEAGKVTIKHGEIKHLEMPSMTMVFTAKNKRLLTSIKPAKKLSLW